MIEPVIAVALLGVLSTYGAARLARRTKHEELESSPYEALAARVVRLEERNDKLEERVGSLEDDKRQDRGWITRTIGRVLEHDGQLVALLIPWPVWYEPTPGGSCRIPDAAVAS